MEERIEGILLLLVIIALAAFILIGHWLAEQTGILYWIGMAAMGAINIFLWKGEFTND